MKKILINFKDIYHNQQNREKRNISKAGLAKKFGISRTTLYKLYDGDATHFDADVLIRICDYFNVPLSELLEYYPEGSSEQQQNHNQDTSE